MPRNGEQPWKFIGVQQMAQSWEGTDTGRANQEAVGMPFDKNASPEGSLVSVPVSGWFFEYACVILGLRCAAV